MTCVLSAVLAHSFAWLVLVLGLIGLGVLVLFGAGYVAGADRYISRRGGSA